MQSEPGPATPLGDLASWQGQRGARGEGVLLTPDLVALSQSGVSVTLAVRREDGRPLVGVGVGCRVRPDGTLRILLSSAANAEFLKSVAAGNAIAATFTSAPDHRAFQVKASAASFRPVQSDDRPELDRQCALLRDGLIEIGFSPELAAGFVGYDPETLAAVEFRPERVFTQTPGPGAGAELLP